ncbi:MAG TPA: type II secretion system F family protein [Deinococcales bacterium]|nr:type II secretion system F family protein [Deinococcales bacterium]
MPTFTYRVRDASGKLMLSTMEAESVRHVRDALREKNFFIVSIEEPKTGLNQEIKIPGLGDGKPNLKAVAVFSRQLATMVGSGLPLVQSLAIMQRQVEHKGFKKILATVRSDVEGGLPFSDALGKHPKVFSRLYLNLVRAGEVSGTLDTVLDRVSSFLEKDLALRGKIKGAMTYPAVVMVFALGITYFLLTTIVPQFGTILKELGGELPFITKALMATSDFLQTKSWLLFLIGVAVFFAYRAYYRTEKGRRVVDAVKLKTPVFGTLIQRAALASFSRTFSLLLRSGVNIIESLEITRGTANNAIVEDAISNAKNAVQRGEQISAPLGAAKIFPPMVVSMVAIGEETGAMDDMLSKVADFYEREVDEAVDQLTAALEPLMIIVLGSIVGLIVAGMFLPMFSIIGQLSQG